MYDATFIRLADKAPDTSTVATKFEEAVKYLHRKKAFTPDMLAKPKPEALIREIADTLQKAVDFGLSDQVIPEAMAEKLKKDVFLFSGFKTYNELREASDLLTTDEGTIKPWHTFMDDVRKLDATYNQRYLEAEYQYAVASSQMAAKWAEAERDGDAYDLQYRTAADDKVRDSHAALNRTTLPPSDPFWEEFFPPNDWGCRCTAVQVRIGKYDRSDSSEARAKGGTATTNIGADGTNKAAIFRYNPGKQAVIFPPKHPYSCPAVGNCSKLRSGGRVVQMGVKNDSDKCRACQVLNKMSV